MEENKNQAPAVTEAEIKVVIILDSKEVALQIVKPTLSQS